MVHHHSKHTRPSNRQTHAPNAAQWCSPAYVSAQTAVNNNTKPKSPEAFWKPTFFLYLKKRNKKLDFLNFNSRL
jgi:hypothetical protein